MTEHISNVENTKPGAVGLEYKSVQNRTGKLKFLWFGNNELKNLYAHWNLYINHGGYYSLGSDLCIAWQWHNKIVGMIFIDSLLQAEFAMRWMELVV